MNVAIHWTKDDYVHLFESLKQEADETYRTFNHKIVNTQLPMLGIRTPVLRKLAKDIGKGDVSSFLSCCEDYYYEELLLQGFVISQIKEDDLSFAYFEHFIHKIDCWAICDMVVSSMKIVKKHKTEYWERIQKMIEDINPFVVRVGIVLLLDYYIEPAYLDSIFDLVDHINRDDYYINMAIAWLLSECYIKYQKETIIYLNQNHLSKFTYHKTIQKIMESNRISREEKERFKQNKRP